MDQVVRDLHIYSTNIDYNKKLEINGSVIDMSGNKFPTTGPLNTKMSSTSGGGKKVY
jgi:hypothetical protein